MSSNNRETGIGIEKITTWGTAAEPSIGDGLKLLTFNPPKGDRSAVDDGNEFDHELPTAIYPGDYPEQTGNMGGHFYYESLERILAAIFGIYASSAPEAGVVKHEFTFDPIIGSIFFTLAWDEGDEIKVVPSMKFKNLRIYYDDGWKWEADFGGDRTQIAAWSDPLPLTYPSDGKGIFRMVNTEIWINAQGGADMADGDKVHPSGCEIFIDPKYITLPVTAGYEGISEHEPGDVPPAFTVTLNFPKKDTTNKGFLTAFDAGTKYKMRIKMTSAVVISGKSNYYTFYLDLPGLYIPEPPTYERKSPIPTTVKFAIYKPAAAPTGMTGTVPNGYVINTVAALTGYPAS